MDIVFTYVYIHIKYMHTHLFLKKGLKYMHQDVNDGYHRESRVTDNFM